MSDFTDHTMSDFTLLSFDHSAKLHQLLLSENRAFEEVMADFDTHLCSVRFRVCHTLCTLIEDKSTLHQSERLVAFCLLHHAYLSPPFFANPFATVLVDVATDEGCQNIERALVLQLLGQKQLLKQSVADYVKGFPPSFFQIFPSREQLQQQYGFLYQVKDKLLKDMDEAHLMVLKAIDEDGKATRAALRQVQGQITQIGALRQVQGQITQISEIDIESGLPSTEAAQVPRGVLFYLRCFGSGLWSYAIRASGNAWRKHTKKLALDALVCVTVWIGRAIQRRR